VSTPAMCRFLSTSKAPGREAGGRGDGSSAHPKGELYSSAVRVDRPTVRDRVAQMATLLILEPIF